MTDVGDLMWTSAKAVLPVFFIMILGSWFVHKGLLDAKAAGALSWLAKYLYSPSLVFVRLGKSFSLEVFSRVGILMPMGVIVLMFNFIMGVLMVPLAKPTRSFRKWFIFSITFQNSMGLPLIFITAVCAGGRIRRPETEIIEYSLSGEDQFYTATECTETGELYLVIYMAIPYVLVFIVAAVLKSSGRQAPLPAKPEATTLEDSSSVSEQDATTDRTASLSSQARDQGPAYTAGTSSFVEAQEPSVELALPAPGDDQDQLEAQQRNPAISSNEGNTAETSFSISQANTNAKAQPFQSAAKPTEGNLTPEDEKREQDQSSPPSGFSKWGRIIYQAFAQPAVVAQIFGLMVGSLPKLQEFMFNTNSVAAPFVNVLTTIAPGLVSVVTLALSLMIGVKMTKTKYSDLLGGNVEKTGISRRTLFVLIFGRMVILPGILFLVLYLCIDLFPKDQLLLMLLFFESFVPTANMCAICAPPEQGAILSLAMINQYLIGVLTMTMWCFIGLTISTNVVSDV
ncbi:Protein PIN-LIKES 3 [Hondaea fermentalgiana]|uniref:Protein PIN-LIKES 3 n=1 Tax=Hondaea fermentalgiana TaxID=2315210 RepID=A0A2R5GCQ7_9STRA|nr:Protein PIN-LIKES 3 [Hondaea fermentalgiana]|eukprot:GBG28756.1 Protein PIN-LIKES 3 [Hondaea fermentalgiana]